MALSNSCARRCPLLEADSGGPEKIGRPVVLAKLVSCAARQVDCAPRGRHTLNMAHIYMNFEFASEEKAQEARHKLETWKQLFRLDKKLTYKFDRPADEETPETGDAAEDEKPAKTKAAAKTKSKSSTKEEQSSDPVTLLVRLAFSGHEKLTQQRWVDRIPGEDPFEAASPKVIHTNDAAF